MSWTPFFSSGKLVKDYDTLKKYLEKVKGTEWYDKGFISNEDFKYLRELLKKKKRVKLGDLWDELTKYFENRVDGKVAKEVLEGQGLKVDEEEARKMIARALAGWLLEAAEEWGYLKFSDASP